MNSTRTATARSVLDRFAGASRRTRWHVRGRWWTCPFPAVLRALPQTAHDVVDVGCGHGLFALLAADTGRHVLGVDVDTAKLDEARAAAGRDPTLPARFATVDLPTEVDAAVVVDVLYLLDPVDQADLVDRLARSLRPGGALVVKEMAAGRRPRMTLLRAQEAAARLVGLTQRSAQRLVFTPPEILAGWMATAGLEVTHLPLTRGYLAPHHLVVGIRSGGTGPARD